jgi:hypothetical protein
MRATASGVGRMLLGWAAALVIVPTARAADCAAAHVPAVTVESATPIVTRDEVMGMAELGRMQSVHSLVSAAKRAVFGLTESSRDARVVISSTARILAPGRYCATVERVQVVLTPRMRVHIAQEAAANDCFREQVLRHEMRHVGLERTFAQREADYVRARLQDVADRLPARVFAAGESQNPWLQETTRYLSDELRRISDEVVPERRARHKAEVDDPDRGRATAVCDGFAKGLIDNYRRQIAEAPAR